jgi:glycosyltransferase involved in cell wall biosynthesis
MVSNKNILMVGPFPKHDKFRGISSVISSYFAVNNFKDYNIRYVSTTSHGNMVSKIAALGFSLVKYTSYLLFAKIKIVHIHSADFRSFFRKSVYALLANVFRKKIILHIHGAQFKEFYSKNPKWLKALISKILNMADFIIVLSESWHEYFQTITNNPNIRVLYNPVNGSNIWAESRKVYKESKNVLYMTMLYTRKGIYDLLNAIPKIVCVEPSAKFLICGEGEIDKCKYISKKLGITDKVNFLGWVGGQDKINILCKADVFVLPSHFEGLPVSLIEAMFAGLPIVSTPVGGIPDFFKDGVNGFLFQVGDSQALAEKIVCLLQNLSLRKKIGQHNRSQASKLFDGNVIVKSLCRIYDEAIEKN